MTELTDRLMAIANEISDDESVCDVGTDHGYLPLYLYAVNPGRKIIMADISRGSLEKCRENCYAAYPEAVFDLRLGSGVEVLRPGEVDCVVMAGMGGILMSELIGADNEHSFKKFILQPRRHSGKLRFWLLSNGYEITNEQLVRESRFIWPILTVKPIHNRYRVSDEISENVFYESEDSVEFEYPASLLDYYNNLTEEYLKNALTIETEILNAKLSGNRVNETVIKEQKHRVEYLSTLLESAAEIRRKLQASSI